MTLSIAEAKKQLQACFPPGSESVYDWDNMAVDIGQHFQAMAAVIKEKMADLADTLRLELNPSTCTQKIPDWESALGLSNTPLAKFGTILQRRGQILSWLRQSGSFSLDDIRAVVQPFLGYANPAQIQIVETDQVALKAAHTYAGTGTPLVIGSNSVGSSSFPVYDSARTSAAGAAVYLTITGDMANLGIVLVSPDGSTERYMPGSISQDIVTAEPYELHFKTLAHRPIAGTWALVITTGAVAATLHFCSIYVDGIGYVYDAGGAIAGEGLGAAQYEFSVIADMALLGTGYDLQGAFRALRRMKPAHVKCGIQTKSLLGTLTAIPDDTQSAIPDQGIPA